ncbi:glycosyltransferase family 39 protein [Paenibacillus planticolens]|uniref:Dolichyl-phosphate-mannose-protein mannosyltransferase n=1 Tax=Paenibacillus planticolens TaxID=2654976 RepID=A0ABX1ZMW1_9BACL|nr:glycosyltransferase family 39 protein [Paenibacillus planticolens]NOV00273.1 hypothetical protein [Paenibacillus planticolens]
MFKIKEMNKYHYFIISLFLLALLIRIVWVIMIPSFPISDFEQYYNVAKSVSEGKGFTVDGVPYGLQGIGYPAALGLYFLLTNTSSIESAKIFNIVISALFMIINIGIANKFFINNRVKLIYISIIFFLPNFIAYNNVLGTEIFFACTFATIVYIQVNVSIKNWRLVILGALVGIATLTKPQFIVYPILYALILWLYTKDLKKTVKYTLIILIPILAIITPYSYRNYKAFDRIIPVSYNSGYVMYLNNNDVNITGEWIPITSIPPSEKLIKDLEKIGVNYGEISAIAEPLYKKEAQKWILAHPIEFMKLGIIRLSNTFFNSKSEIREWAMNGYPEEKLKSLNFLRAIDVFSRVSANLILILSISSILFLIFNLKKMLVALFSKSRKLAYNISIPFLNISFFFSVYFVYEGQPRYNFPVLFLLAMGFCYFVEIIMSSNQSTLRKLNQ